MIYRQDVYKTWIQNNINSTDRRNGRNGVSISKTTNLQKYGSMDYLTVNRWFNDNALYLFVYAEFPDKMFGPYLVDQ